MKEIDFKLKKTKQMLVRNLKKGLLRTHLYYAIKNYSKDHLILQSIKKSEYDKILKTGLVELPSSAKMEATMRCNLHCQMCHQAERRKKDANELSLDECKRLFDNISSNGVNNILLTGGEIFVRKDIFDIFSYLDGKGMYYNIISNGTLISENNIGNLKSCRNLKGIECSLDGIEETHNRIRNSKDCFGKTINTVKLASTRFPVKIASVIQKENLNEIPRLIEIAADSGAVEVQFMNEMFHTKEEVEASRKMMGLGSDVEIYANYHENPAHNYSLDELIWIKKVIEDTGKKNKIVTSFYPKASDGRYFREFYNGTIRNIESKKSVCEGFLKNVFINNKGDVLFCPFIKKSFGNLLEKPLSEIWNSEEIRDFRIRLLEHNMLPLCERCCGTGLVV